MSGNTELWDKLGRTDPAHTKQFKRAGGFSGTAIKPMWAYKRMTEEFGPCGKGWGIGEPSFQVVPGPEGEMLVYCTASVWYIAADESGPHTVFGVGGDKAVGKNKYGLTGDDEAFKKAFTDAITNALKMIGVGADVHMGMFDDSKYVNALKGEFSEKADEPRTTDQRSEQGRREVAQQNNDKPISSAEQKRQLAEIDRDLLDCDTVHDVNKCAKVWAEIMARDGWAKDFKEEAAKKFEPRRQAIRDREAQEDDSFPGDRPTGIRDASGRELSNAEAL